MYLWQVTGVWRLPLLLGFPLQMFLAVFSNFKYNQCQMPPQRKDLNPCGIEGHSIQSIKKGVTVLPPTQSMGAQIVDDFIVVCVRCCRTLDEIRSDMKGAQLADS